MIGCVIAVVFFKSDSYLPKKNYFIYLIESFLKVMNRIRFHQSDEFVFVSDESYSQVKSIFYHF